MRSKTSASVQHASQHHHSLEGDCDDLILFLARAHAQDHLPSFLFIPHSISLVFTFRFSRDIYYSSHPPFDINYHIVSSFSSLSRRGNMLRGLFSPPPVGDDSLSARPSICSSLACPSVISLKGRQPVRGTCPRLPWAWPCI